MAKPLTISTSATATTLRPKNMAELYGAQTVYLMCKGGRPRLTDLRGEYQERPVLHLLWGVSEWADAAEHFGEIVAEFDPHRRTWLEPRVFHVDERLTLRELLALIGDGEVCMGGKECPKHRR